MRPQTIYVSATPGGWEMERAGGVSVLTLRIVCGISFACVLAELSESAPSPYWEVQPPAMGRFCPVM